AVWQRPVLPAAAADWHRRGPGAAPRRPGGSASQPQVVQGAIRQTPASHRSRRGLPQREPLALPIDGDLAYRETDWHGAEPALDLVASSWDTTKHGVDVLAGISDKYQPATQYPNNAFGKTLQQVSQMLAADIGTRVFYVQLGGFDTHANEKAAHAGLMTQLADSLAAFQADLEAHNRADQVLTMAFS